MRYLPALLVALLFLTGCEEKQPMSVADFMGNEAALYGTLTRCQENPSAGTDPECRNARQAAERIAVIEERAMRKAREEAFASAREEYRAQLDRERELRLKAEAEAEEARLRALLSPEPDAGETDDGSRPADGADGVMAPEGAAEGAEEPVTPEPDNGR
jgi:hypothetical protein